MKIGLFGLGRLGSFHAKTLRELDTVSDLFLWDPRTDRCEAMASELDARPAQTREELFDQCDALAMFWQCVGNILAMFWQCFGDVLAMF